MNRRKAMQGISVSALAFSATSWAFRGSRVFANVAGGIRSFSRAPATLRTKSADMGAAAFAAEGLSARPPFLSIQATRYKPEVSSAQIDQLVRSMQEALSRIPQIKSLRVGQVIGENRAYDYVVVMEFDNLDDMKSYGNSDIHKNWVREHNPVALTATDTALTLQMDSSP
jgi:hypothetical protein